MIVVDLFAGGGGASCGLRRAGFEHAACVDSEPDAVATLCAAGFPGICVRVEDVAAWWSGERPDAVWASPPCQPFSQAGLGRGEKDGRNGFPALWTALDALRPTWLMVEQVPALSYWQHRLYFSRVLMEVGRRFPWLDWQILDAADYGVPQHRRRLILLAGPRPVCWPAPTHVDPRHVTFTDGRPWVTTREALGIGVFSLATAHKAGVPFSARRTWDLSDRPGLTVPASHVGGAGIMFAADPRQPPVVPDSPFRVLGRRSLTMEECATLQAFPADWPFRGTKTSCYRQVGNAVPPPLSEAIGRAVLAQLPGCRMEGA